MLHIATGMSEMRAHIRVSYLCVCVMAVAGDYVLYNGKQLSHFGMAVKLDLEKNRSEIMCEDLSKSGTAYLDLHICRSQCLFAVVQVYYLITWY